MKYDIVLWDFDGTLVDTSEGIFDSLRVAFAAEKLPSPDEKLLAKFIGPTILSVLKSEFLMDDDQANRMITCFRADYADAGVYRSEIYPGLIGLNERLREHGQKVGIATLKPEHMARLLLDHFGISGLFDVCVGSVGDEKAENDKAGMIDRALRELGYADRSRVVMIGDTVIDAEGARKAGVNFIAVGYGFGALSDASWLPDCGGSVARDADELEKLLLAE